MSERKNGNSLVVGNDFDVEIVQSDGYFKYFMYNKIENDIKVTAMTTNANVQQTVILKRRSSGILLCEEHLNLSFEEVF